MLKHVFVSCLWIFQEADIAVSHVCCRIRPGFLQL